MTITPTPQRRKPTHNLLPLTKSIFMASLLSLSLLSFICFVYLSASSSSAASHHRFHRTPPPPSHLIKPKPRSKPPTPLPKTTTNPPEIILKACKATRFPDICQSSLSNYSQVPQNPTPLQLIQSALSLSAANLKTAQSMAKSILESAAGSINRTNAANNCLEVLANSMYRISSTDDALPRGRTKDARAWTSAALLYQYDCWNALKYANDTSQTDQTMSFLSTLMSFTSNALSMIVSYDLHGDQIASWGPPKTERDGFWRAQSAGSEGNLTTFGGLFPSKLTVDATVCKDGGNNGCYKTVQEAVNAAPDNESGRKFVISIKEGVYEEIVKVPLEKKNVVFLGDGIGKTVITGSLNAGQPGVATYNTATVGTRKHQHLPSYLPSCTKAPEAEIRIACKATLHPESCQSSIIRSNQVPPNPVPLQIMQSALWVSSENLKTARSMLESVLRSSKGNQNITQVAKSCLEVLGNSQYRISQSNDTLPRGQIKNARAWMSAALAYQNDCYGGLKYHAGNILSVNATMSFLDTLIGYTSNALSMIVSYDLFGNATEFWQPPLTERDGFWEGPGLSSAVRLKGHIPSISKADVTVCKDRSTGCYRTVQEAVNAAPDNAVDSRFVIYIKEGVYEEIVRVPFEKKNVAFLGDGTGKTVITGMQSVSQPGVTTYESATVGVLGDGFMASGLTIQNTAGAPTHQAVALRLDSDLSFIENCEFLGNQDTLYAHSLRQYYKSCRIQGNVDFIFGNSAAIFENCTILVKPRQEKPEKGETNAVTAQGRTDPAQSTGFVFQNCLINGTEEYMALYRAKASVHKNFLGRPWKEYSRVVFINCILEGLITPAGWLPWTGDFALKTLYYGEFGNSGPGSDVSQRVSWSNQIPAEHVNTYSVQNFIQGDEWIPTSS